ncbi:hypothetical protein [Solitalea canadensis]|uniref:Uncharacterized protein n=1 Tax=Solitalea canadensis (strain ATCC 29591 / DSM 3403 / JCM 21819 / LMG 8368 / NBRC 15130 / NCIMB 12057 / USAM 9D) TaxID=929556 RepID=H8KTQ0_SOLCM|nr:hypothetical protein [Solitalea canadensis]AFD06625.1 hypothetical protein Solca_1552 [Solitalea canadensis DSM 3403]
MEIKLEKTDKIILYSLFSIPAILLLIFFVWSVSSSKPVEEFKKEDDLRKEFVGRVDTLYFEKQNHNIKIAKLSNGYKYQIFRRWEIEIEIGDSLAKEKGSFFVKIYKKNGRVITLDYRDTYLKKQPIHHY